MNFFNVQTEVVSCPSFSTSVLSLFLCFRNRSPAWKITESPRLSTDLHRSIGSLFYFDNFASFFLWTQNSYAQNCPRIDQTLSAWEWTLSPGRFQNNFISGLVLVYLLNNVPSESTPVRFTLVFLSSASSQRMFIKGRRKSTAWLKRRRPQEYIQFLRVYGLDSHYAQWGVGVGGVGI